MATKKARIASKWGTLGGRLRWAIDRQVPQGKSRGVGLLIAKLDTADTTGANYQSITNYLNDEVRPPIDFIENAARALSVRPAWLAWGDGQPTEAAQAAASVSIFDQVRRAIPELDVFDPTIMGLLIAFSTRWVDMTRRAGEPGTDDLAGRPAWIHAWNKFVVPPFGEWVKGWNVDASRVDPVGFSRYAAAMLHALDLGLDVIEQAWRAGNGSEGDDAPEA